MGALLGPQPPDTGGGASTLPHLRGPAPTRPFRRIGAPVILAIVVCTASVGAGAAFIVEERARGAVCLLPSTGGIRFEDAQPKENGSIDLVLNSTDPSELTSIQANASWVAIVVLYAPVGGLSSNVTLNSGVSTLESEGILVLGYVPERIGGPSEVLGYAESGFNGIYLAASSGLPGACSANRLVDFAHELGGYAAAATGPGGSPSLAGANLTVRYYPASAWSVADAESIRAPRQTAVVLENASNSETELLLGSLHALGVSYFQVANGSVGAELLPSPAENDDFATLYDSHQILAPAWIAPMSDVVDQIGSNGTVYFLELNGTGFLSPWYSWLTVVAVNTTLGVPEFFSHPVPVPALYYSQFSLVADEEAEWLTLEGGTLYAIAASIYWSGAWNWNLAVMSFGFNCTTGALSSEFNESIPLLSPSSLGAEPLVTGMGPNVLAIAPLASSAVFGDYWIGSYNALTGGTIGNVTVNLTAGPTSGVLVRPLTYEFQPLGSDLAFESMARVINQSTLNSTYLGFTCLIEPPSTAIPLLDRPAPLSLSDGQVYFTELVGISTFLESFNLSRGAANAPIDLGSLGALVGPPTVVAGEILLTEANGTYLSFSLSGRLLWSAQVPVPSYDYALAPIVLPGGRLLVGSAISFISGWVSGGYEQLFEILNLSTGELLADYPQWGSTFPVSPLGVFGTELAYDVTYEVSGSPPEFFAPLTELGPPD